MMMVGGEMIKNIRIIDAITCAQVSFLGFIFHGFVQRTGNVKDGD